MKRSLCAIIQGNVTRVRDHNEFLVFLMFTRLLSIQQISGNVLLKVFTGFGFGLEATLYGTSIPGIDFNTDLDPRFKAPAKRFPDILNLEYWIPNCIEDQYKLL